MANSKLFSYESLVHAIAGATGGVIAMSTFFPLDTVRSRLQVSSSVAESTYKEIKKILEREGFVSLYKGMTPLLESLYISNFVYFYTFHGLKASLSSDGAPTNEFLIGLVAGAVNVVLTNPFWVVNTRLKFEATSKNFRNLLGGIHYIYKTEGVKALWSGAMPSLLLVSNPAIQFMLYEYFKRHLTRGGETHLPMYAAFLTGALAKCIATISTYPLQLAQTKLRHGETKERRLFHLITQILRENGLLGLYKGLEAKLLQTVLTAALMFAMYEKIFAFIVNVLKVPLVKG